MPNTDLSDGILYVQQAGLFASEECTCIWERMTDRFPWEFGYIVDQERRETGFAVVRGRVDRASYLEFLRYLARDYRIMAITSQGVFPMIGDGPGNLPDHAGPQEGRHEDYVDKVEGWAHCFRDPDAFLPAGKPRLRFSNSDNLEPDRLWRIANRPGPLEKRWDFVYSCMPDRSNFIRKNWAMAKRCALRFAEDLGLRGLLVGVAEVNDAPRHPLIDLRPPMRWREFLRALGESRVGFFPNTWDPSPRVIAEAMCLDVPILVNHDILGGWQYVAPESGRFFRTEDDALDAMTEVLAGSFSPRDWYCSNYGRSNAGRRLAAFIGEIAGSERFSDVEIAYFYSPRDYDSIPPRPRRHPN